MFDRGAAAEELAVIRSILITVDLGLFRSGGIPKTLD